jgi:hypothetical protein
LSKKSFSPSLSTKCYCKSFFFRQHLDGETNKERGEREREIERRKTEGQRKKGEKEIQRRKTVRLRKKEMRERDGDK